MRFPPKGYLKKVYKSLNEKQRQIFNVGGLNRAELIAKETGGFKDFYERSIECEDCEGPMHYESGWGYACSNKCWNLEFHRLREEQKEMLNLIVGEKIYPLKKEEEY